MTAETGRARLEHKLTVHVVREHPVDRGRLWALCGTSAALPLWASNTWCPGAAPCEKCTALAARRRSAP